MFKELIQQIRSVLGHLLRLAEDAADEDEVIAGIEKGVEFRGAKLWILVLAVFVASLGLNTNSAAVIIGAMLISPLMGPIIGMGLGAGIYDFELLRRSWRNYIVATLFSVATATIYFLITPIAEAQSELLARTSPTIYDVAIALCGGLAGIIALSSRSQRTGNVIPGVAIATALMPPLCTVGFGIATANWAYAAGALYLFLINTMFIVLATLVGVVFIMRFRQRTFVDPKRERRVKRLIYGLAIVTIIPSIILTYGMVRENYFEQRVGRFIQQELHFDHAQVVSHRADYSAQTFDVVLIGEEVDSAVLKTISDRLSEYQLEGVAMHVVQGSSGINSEEFRNLMQTTTSEAASNEALLAQQTQNIADLEHQLRPYTEAEALAQRLLPEMRVLWPQVESVTMARGLSVMADSTAVQTVALVTLALPLNPSAERERMERWLSERTAVRHLQVVFSQAKE